MQSLSVKKGFLKEEILIPSSKSYANRALILASRKQSPVTLKRIPQASDVTILIDCLKTLGIDISSQGDEVIIRNSFPECEKGDAEISVGEGGTTARFIAALCLTGSSTYTLKLGKRLKARPWQEFIDQVNSLGATAKLQDDKLSLKGPLKLPTRLEVDCSKTTQFATAFQLIAPPDVKVIPTNLRSSESYWKMTEKIIHDLNADNYSVPLDWSSASYPLAFAALHQTIRFPGLTYDEFQADAKFLSILKKFEAVTEKSSGLEVHSGKSEGNLSFDVNDALDLVPTLAYYLSHIKGTHRLSGIGNLVHKESDRLSEVIKLMSIFKRKAEVQNEALIIHGHHEKISQAVTLNLPDDHRMVMVGTLFLLHHAGGTVSPAEAVNKSYPDFFDLISKV